MTQMTPSYPQKAQVWILRQLLGDCDLLTRISADLSDVFSDMSEVTSHKAAVILAVERTPPGGWRPERGPGSRRMRLTSET